MLFLDMDMDARSCVVVEAGASQALWLPNITAIFSAEDGGPGLGGGTHDRAEERGYGCQMHPADR